MMMSWEEFAPFLPALAAGARMTVALTLATLLLGFAIALPVALCRKACSRPARAFATLFVFLFRGTPVLALMYMIYYGSPELAVVRQTPLWALFRDPVACAVLALSLNSAGYLTEVIAGALRSVPTGQIEAARALGLGRWRTFRFVEAPNALRIGLRSYGNEVVFVLKGTSAASLITVADVLAVARQIYDRTFDPLTPMLAAGALYLAFVAVLIGVVRLAERRVALVER
ncbi:MAG: ABC transporter permease subunit [Novosphingobium sp.]|jgi:His/Glu/Gln/Arg/opine family amino acid ABC transporter permease subunit|uniref:ABC transporter permease n=1 Tax=Novosphingobium sp. TaxID=1874826 RepID=UPI0022C038DD|nr:ABC transporter permease subunit [Novosphingobium sp.]MCZ8036513.1 ABC transporter permease subunit [Novosphingobium sp.]